MTLQKRWTQAHITELRTRIRAGGTAAEAADHLGREVEDVTAMMSRLRLQAPLYPVG